MADPRFQTPDWVETCDPRAPNPDPIPPRELRGVDVLDPSQNPPQSLPDDASDRPSVPPPDAQISASTVISAPESNPPTARRRGRHSSRNHGPNPRGETSTISEGEHPRQVLGRRQRSADENDGGGPVEEQGDVDGDGGPGSNPPSAPSPNTLRSAEATDFAAQQPSPKRRRRNTMLADGEETRASNGTTRGFPYGSASPALHGMTRSSTNGTLRSGAVNGSSHSDKDMPSSMSRLSPTYLGHDREEVTRLLIQALSGMGYNSIAQSLSQESGYQLENETVAAFRAAVLNGAWTEAEDLLSGAVAADEYVPEAPGLVLAPGSDRDAMRFWIRQQKFLELLEQRENSRALRVLRSQLTPLRHDTPRLHLLSSLLMCQSIEDVKARAGWDGASGESRRALLSQLSKCISPSVMLPENRLAGLLQQVKQRQIDTCLYHTAAGSPSLYSDHFCDKSKFPSELAITLTDLDGEIWQIKFSNNGQWLAACGTKSEVVVWDVNDFGVAATLIHDEEQNYSVTNISWSPDDSYLVSCSMDRSAKIWDTKTWTMTKQVEKCIEPVTGCVWAPDGKSFTLSALDKTCGLRTFDLKGDLIHDWNQKYRVRDVSGSSDGRWLAAIDTENVDQANINIVRVYNALTRELEYEMNLGDRLMSVSIGSDCRHMLVNKYDGEAHLIDLVSRELVQKFLGYTADQCLIRAAFGGANESFVVCGSEDGNVWVWHKATGAAVERLSGHHPRSNSVSWNPANPCMLASCGDDGKIKIWSNKEEGDIIRSICSTYRQFHHPNGRHNGDLA